MTARRVITWRNTGVLKPSEKVSIFDEGIVKIANDLYHTMIASFGAGIAAPQIGEKKSVCVVSSNYVPSLNPDPKLLVGDAVVLINPVINPIGEETFVWEEQCLSVPDFSANVKRYKTVEVQYQNLSGDFLKVEVSDVESGTIQHEVDHLYGKLFIHRLSGLSRKLAFQKLRKNYRNSTENSSIKSKKKATRSKKKPRVKKPKTYGKNKNKRR